MSARSDKALAELLAELAHGPEVDSVQVRREWWGNLKTAISEAREALAESEKLRAEQSGAVRELCDTATALIGAISKVRGR